MAVLCEKGDCPPLLKGTVPFFALSALHRYHFYADRHRDLDRTLRRPQLAGVGVDTEDDDAVRVRVGDQKEGAGRVDAEVARRLDPVRLVPHIAQRTGLRIDRENGDAIVAAVRAVKKFARRVDL